MWRGRTGIETEFRLPLVSPRLMAIVVLHGFLDLAHPESLVAYAAALLPNRPPHSVRDSVAFGVASVLHFAHDASVLESVALHVLIVMSYWLVGARVAVVLVLAHFHLVHLPRLWFQAFEEPRPAEMLLLIAGLFVSLVAPKRVCATFLHADLDDGVFVLSWPLQRLVACHVVASLIRYPR